MQWNSSREYEEIVDVIGKPHLMDGFGYILMLVSKF